jgi:two-component system chemotaxis sensor kinase CheA
MASINCIRQSNEKKMDQSKLRNEARLRQCFIDEASAILVDLEAALHKLDHHPSDMELVGRIFRGLHTIKGSAAMFGFEQLAAFTQNLEAAFNEIRNGRLQADSGMIALALSALNRIRAMLEQSTEGTPGARDSRG